MQGDPMRMFLVHCGYWRVDSTEEGRYELWSNGSEFVSLAIGEQGLAHHAVLEDRFSAELNLEDLLALLEFPFKQVA